MNSFSEFDHFLIDLAREINRSPESKESIISQALEASECPYLKEKIKGYLMDLTNSRNTVRN